MLTSASTSPATDGEYAYAVRYREGGEYPIYVRTPPLLLYGYGSYGSTIQARFSTSILSVVERGVVYATAHIRGGAGSSSKLYDPSHPLLKDLL
jgi:protease II